MLMQQTWKCTENHNIHNSSVLFSELGYKFQTHPAKVGFLYSEK